MMRIRIFVTVLVLLAVAAVVHAQTQSAPVGSGFRADWKQNLDGVKKKVLDLAEAMPAEKYSWRPAEGVRSVGEVYMHIAIGNYFLLSRLGITPPADAPARDAEKTVTEKAKIIESLKRSYDFVQSTFDKATEADMQKKIDFFGTPLTGQGIYLTLISHNHEHLGQSIAYARMNGVVPPWSAKD